MTDIEQRFHENWLGMVQPSEGLVVSLPVLLEAQCMQRHAPALQHSLLALCASEEKNAPPRVDDLPRFLAELLKLTPDLWDATAGYRPDVRWSGTLPDSLAYYAPEGGQTIAPTLGLRKQNPAAGRTAPADAAAAGSAYQLLLWELPPGVDLDKPECVTGPWEYPPRAKFERLLREARVPIGLLINGDTIRLMYAPAGESTGHIDFRLADMSTVGGRPILDALVMLLHAQRFFSVAADKTLPAMLADSRKYQADVTTQLGQQVLEALTILLRGFEAAAERDGKALIEEALARENDHLYQGLLTVLLRMVFVLYAEDREAMPVEHDLYEEHYSLFGLFEDLQADYGAYPDSMSRRYGGWGRLVALFRAVYLGICAGELNIPERRGSLFNPHEFAFLEGWDPAGNAPISDLAGQSRVKLPTLDDQTLYEVLKKLILLNGQRLSYKALDVEQIGSVYEGLMGYHVKRVQSPSVRMRPEGVWVEIEEILAVPIARRQAWLAQEVGLAKAQAKTLAKSVESLEKPDEVLQALEGYAVGRTREQRASGRARPGQLVLQPGQERRRTSSHYTPRALSERVVSLALSPLLKAITCKGEPGPASDHILQLRICDPAMGSGAFLVEACRQLGEVLEAAWRREGQSAKYRDPTLAARRRVAQCCLYGVDKNAMAVELAKLSLWLTTLDKSRPFTFMDSSLRHGDSLVGLSLDEIRAFHWKPGKQLELFVKEINVAVDEAIDNRQRLIEMAYSENGQNPSPREKERLERDSKDALERVRLIADVCIGAFFAEDNQKARERERLRRLDLVRRWLGEEDAEKGTAAEQELRELQSELKKTQTPFHWMLEFPEVFWDKRPDPLEDGKKNSEAFIDAFVGNMPYSGKNGISAAGGDRYIPWLQAIHEGAHGNADLCAHFFRRCSNLLGKYGTLGLIATNTIAQGDSRSTGLQPLVADGLRIFNAITDMQWPGVAAAVTVSIVHLTKGKRLEAVVEPRLNGKACKSINSGLISGEDRSNPKNLTINQGRAFVGTYVLGMGFTLTPEERDALIKHDRRNASRIFPYLGGSEVNTSPTQNFDRYVISFGTMSLEEAEHWPDLLSIVRKKVKPERDKNKRDNYRLKWWQFGEARPGLYKAIAPLERCLVTSRVTKHLSFSFQPTDRVFSEALYVFPLDSYTAFVTLQSRIHEPWARLLSSSMKTDLRYSASDCFDTFPFPKPDPRTVIPALEKAGKALYEARAKYMANTEHGLTKTYNALKDPSCQESRVLKLRELHQAMDCAVLDAYGWSDVTVPPFCPANDPEQKALKSFEAEIIDRLYALNAERAAEEERLGVGQKPAKKAKKKKPAGGLKPPASVHPPKSGKKRKPSDHKHLRKVG